MSTETLDPVAEILAGELEELRQAIAASEWRLEYLTQLLSEAQDAEGEALQVLGQANAAYAPLLLETKEGEGQIGLFHGDTPWRTQHPRAAEGFDRWQAAEQARKHAGQRVLDLNAQLKRVRVDLLPSLRGALTKKQEELEQHQQRQAQAMAQAKSWRDKLGQSPVRRGDKHASQ